jgi:hypothetical protein
MQRADDDGQLEHARQDVERAERLPRACRRTQRDRDETGHEPQRDDGGVRDRADREDTTERTSEDHDPVTDLTESRHEEEGAVEGRLREVRRHHPCVHERRAEGGGGDGARATGSIRPLRRASLAVGPGEHRAPCLPDDADDRGDEDSGGDRVTGVRRHRSRDGERPARRRHARRLGPGRG